MNYVDTMVRDRLLKLAEERANVAERSASMWKTVAQSLLAGYGVLIVYALIH